MPIIDFPKDGQYAKKVVVVSDGGFHAFGVDQTTIVLTKSAIVEGAMVARDYYSKGRITFDDVQMPTYQELQARLNQLEVTRTEHVVEMQRLSGLVNVASARVVDKQLIIKVLEAETLVAEEKVIARKNASFLDLFREFAGYRKRNWWQRLFKVGK